MFEDIPEVIKIKCSLGYKCKANKELPMHPDDLEVVFRKCKYYEDNCKKILHEGRIYNSIDRDCKHAEFIYKE